jgi:hypothetical protein
MYSLSSACTPVAKALLKKSSSHVKSNMAKKSLECDVGPLELLNASFIWPGLARFVLKLSGISALMRFHYNIGPDGTHSNNHGRNMDLSGSCRLQL